jgi:hypothetical protein
MDPNVPKNNSTTKQYWTHEKHLHFFKSIMEASFVRTMLENNGLVLRLYRYLPLMWQDKDKAACAADPLDKDGC